VKSVSDVEQIIHGKIFKLVDSYFDILFKEKVVCGLQDAENEQLFTICDINWYPCQVIKLFLVRNLLRHTSEVAGKTVSL
jgi:hypothetical protein